MSEFNENTEKSSEVNTEVPVAGHGVGDRKQYYQKWETYTKEAVSQLTAEEEEIKKQLEEEKSKHAISEANKKDLEKRAALKEAKKQWDNVKMNEESMKVCIENEEESKRILHYEKDLEGRRVVLLRNNNKCDYELTDMNLTKIFIENCNHCHILLNCNLITSNIEIAHCNHIKVIIGKYPSHTIQIDLSDHITIHYYQDLMTSNCKVFHSNVSNLRIEYDENGNGHDIHYQDLNDYELSTLTTLPIPSSDQQFVTKFMNGNLITDLVLRDAQGHILTQREIIEKKEKIELEAKKNGIPIESEAIQRLINEVDAEIVTPQQRGGLYKEEGNKAFRDNDYGQANVHYTQAIDCYESMKLYLTSTEKEQLCISYSNRAACSLKLGDHLNALNDTNAAIALDENHVKSIFRKGLALHALGRYHEACTILNQALKLNPKDKSIQSALTFADRKAQLTPRY